MIDNHLYDMTNLVDGTLAKVDYFRKLFIALDDELCKLGNDSHGHRQLIIARTHIEQALEMTVKTVKMQGEKTRYQQGA